MRKVLLGRIWAKMELLDQMGVGKGHLSRNKRFGAKLGSLGKMDVRKGLLGRKEGFLSHHRAVLSENGFKVLLGKVWTKMGLLQKMGVGKGHLDRTYQSLYGLKTYNLSEGTNFDIRVFQLLTSCQMMQFKGMKTLKLAKKLALKWKLMFKKFICPLIINM